MTSKPLNFVLASILALVCGSGEAVAGRGGFRGGGGGFSGGGFRAGGFSGGGGYGGGGFRAGGFSGGGGYGGGGYRAGGFSGGGVSGGGYRAGGGFQGGYGGSSFNRTPSFSASQSYGGYGGMRATGGQNPYAAGGTSSRSRESASGPLGGQYQSGSRSGSITTEGGSTIRYGAAGVGGTGPGGTVAGRGVGGVQVTGPDGRSVTNVGRAGGAVGPGGNAIGGRANIGVASGPGGVAVAGSRGGFASGPGGVAVAGSRGGVAAGPGGVVAAGARGGVVAGPGGAVAGRGYGVAGGYGWHNPAYTAYHAGWVHGSWNGHYGGWGWGGYGAGVATGLVAWGLGSALYSGWGYMPYSNPYVDAPTTEVQQPVYDYSQPISTTDSPPDAAVTDPALTAFDQAREAFKAGSYDKALPLTDQALKAMPNDSTIHQFRAMVLFALGRYDEAAAALYGVLSVGPGWDWTTLIGLYPDIEVYTAQLGALDQFIRSNPNSAAPRFVLSYLYLTAGQNDAAAGQLKAVTGLQPNDRVSAQLLQSIAKAQPQGAAPGATPQPDVAPAQAPVEPAKGGTLAGTWTASPDKGSTIALSFAAQGDFTWKVTTQGQAHSLAGQSTYGSGVLTLVQAEGGPPMVGRVTWQDADHFVFQALGGGTGDPGLSFSRSS